MAKPIVFQGQHQAPHPGTPRAECRWSAPAQAQAMRNSAMHDSRERCCAGSPSKRRQVGPHCCGHAGLRRAVQPAATHCPYATCAPLRHGPCGSGPATWPVPQRAARRLPGRPWCPLVSCGSPEQPPAAQRCQVHPGARWWAVGTLRIPEPRSEPLSASPAARPPAGELLGACPAARPPAGELLGAARPKLQKPLQARNRAAAGAAMSSAEARLSDAQGRQRASAS